MKAAVLLAVLAALFSSCAHNRYVPEYKVRRNVFPNGLTVLFVEDHSVPVVSYTTWFKVGSSWEKRGSTGIAHLFEHLMFKGTPRFPAKQFFANLERRGAMVNAFTQRDATVYYEVISSQHLESVIDMESDRLANLILTQTDLDAERQVVKEERRLRVESNFSAQQMEELQSLAFPEHPYGWPIIGYQDDLDRLSLNECQDFFKTYYQPGNAIITISGDFDYEQVKGWIEKYYGKLAGRGMPDLKLTSPPAPAKEVRKIITRPVEAESLLIGYRIPSMFHDDAQKLSMLAWAMFGMSSSRANLKLVREKQVALDVSADANLEKFPSLFLISVELKRGVPSESAEKELDALIEEAKKVPLSTDELERVKNKLIYATVNEAKSPAGVASWLASGEFYWNDYKHTYKALDAYHLISPKDLMRMAQKYFIPENRVVVVMKPEQKAYAKKTQH